MLIKKVSLINKAKISLPASKSVANRALIINHLAENTATIQNLSQARDTQTLNELLSSSKEELDVLDAGTTMRFLTAYLAINKNTNVLTGSSRMQQRPIGILVDALRELGATINYLKQEGYPPLIIGPYKEQATKTIHVRGDVSSQYISALMMIGPSLPQGLSIELTGKIGSRPYILMTLKIMEAFGISNITFEDSYIKIPHQPYVAPGNFYVEPDWSGASYWYALLAISDLNQITLKDLKPKSFQGDQQIAEIMTDLGVKTTYNEDGAILTKAIDQKNVKIDFSDCPDLAQTIMTISAVKGITCKMTGLESLKIKETDRVLAMRNELAKIGAKLIEKNSEWIIEPSHRLPDHAGFDTYEDHRMAMSLAPLASLFPITINDPEVVAKSYPNYWEEFEKLGFQLKE